jgi:hypothetical protein
MGAGLSPFPYALIYPQDEHERLLIDRLAEAGVQVERGTEILGVDEASDHVLARLKQPDGAQETLCARRKLPLHVFAWRPAMRRTGLQRNAVYLVRPDGYVALADPARGARTLSSYLDVRKLTPRTPS